MTLNEINLFCSDPNMFFTQKEWIESESGQREHLRIYDFKDDCFLYAERSSRGEEYIWITSCYRKTEFDLEPEFYNPRGICRHVEICNLREEIFDIIDRCAARELLTMDEDSFFSADIGKNFNESEFEVAFADFIFT